MMTTMLSRACQRQAVRTFMATTEKGAAAAAAAATRGSLSLTWSEHLSFTSPESDFAAASLRHASTAEALDVVEEEWTEQISFASPYSDFSAPTEQEMQEAAARKEEWSDSYSFSSPFNDFTAESAHLPTMIVDAAAVDKDWSNSISYASASSDFMAPTHAEQEEATRLVQEDYIHHVVHPNFARDSLATTEAMSFAGALSDFSSPLIAETHDQLLKLQLADKNDERPLPSSLSEVLALSEEEGIRHDQVVDDRAIVVTERTYPFRIVHVNAAWEGLCGYTLEQSRGKSLGDLLQGPETDLSTVQALMNRLEKQDSEAQAVLINYTKTGRKFRNHLRVGTLQSEDDEKMATHFVGVLRDIDASVMPQQVAI